MGIVHTHIELAELGGQKPGSGAGAAKRGWSDLKKEPWVYMSSREIVISKTGQTVLCTDFSGCVGVVMCGAGKWGAVSHLHQEIQLAGRSMTNALEYVASFVRTQVKAEITDVLLFFGDPGANLGEHQLERAELLTAEKVKAVMKCTGSVIDRRRNKSAEDKYKARTGESYVWGNDFVYDPEMKKFYTATRGTIGLMMDENKVVDLAGKYKPFFGALPADKQAKENEVARRQTVKGMAEKGWCIVP